MSGRKAVPNNSAGEDLMSTDERRLKLLSYNIQAGVDTRRYHHYFTQSWKHVLPHR